MRRKSDFNNSLDEMFSQDDKKRINAIKMIREIAATIGPLRVRNELIPFMNQFLDDDPQIMLAVIEELDNFTPLLGGSQHQKTLLPLLINFCLLDEKQVALKSLAIITQILSRNTDCYLETIKKMCKPDMNVSKQCTLQLIVSGLKKLPQLQTSFLEIYKTISSSQNSSYRICAAKYVKKIAENTNNKEQICKIMQIFFNDSEDLSKLYAIDTLLLIYPSNPNLVIGKLKILICMGTWRINIKLCEFANDFSQVLTKVHFKSLLQPAYLKMLVSDDNEIKAAACSTMISIAKNMSEDDNLTKFLPTVLKLSETKVDFVKNQFAKNFVKIFPYFPPEKTKEIFIPLVIKFLKESNLEVYSRVLEDFKELSNYFKDQKFEQNILKPIANQLAAENWRLKIQTLDILGKIIVEQQVYSPFVIDLLIRQMKSKIEAVRLKASSVIVNVIKKSPKEWCEKFFLPQLFKSKDDTSYLIRQRIIAIICETVDSVSIPWVTNYSKLIGTFLCDKTPNIRVLALRSICENRKLMDKSSQNIVCKLRDDNDLEIKQVAKQIKI